MSEKRVWPQRPNPPTVVDYEAWKKGYMPPSDHILIHKLSYEEAHIKMSMNFDSYEWWLVLQGDPTLDQLKGIARCIKGLIEAEEEILGRKKDIASPSGLKSEEADHDKAPLDA